MLIKSPILYRSIELFINPAIKFPNRVVELKAMAALIIIPKKPKSWPFNSFSIGRVNIKAKTPVKINKIEMVCLVIINESFVDFIRLNIHLFAINSMIMINNTSPGVTSEMIISII